MVILLDNIKNGKKKCDFVFNPDDLEVGVIRAYRKVKRHLKTGGLVLLGASMIGGVGYVSFKAGELYSMIDRGKPSLEYHQSFDFKVYKNSDGSKFLEQKTYKLAPVSPSKPKNRMIEKKDVSI